MKLLLVLPWLLPVMAESRSSTTAGAEPVWSRALEADATSDAEIANKVHGAILADESLRYDAANVRVSVRDGVVTLSGTVHRDPIRLRMAQVARHAAPGARVVSLITLEPKYAS